MLEGPYRSTRWRDHFSRMAELSDLLWLAGLFFYVAVQGYFFWADGEFFKLALLIAAAVVVAGGVAYLVIQTRRRF